MKPAGKSPAAAPSRRRPRQSRARHTALALQQAFVQLLVERDYSRITIREIVLVAGTSLGSFYDYFASKEDLARVCLHLRSKALLAALHEAIGRHSGRPLAELTQAMLHSQIEAHRGAAREWGAHYLLERHLSGAEAYRKMYRRFVDEWMAGFAAASDLPSPLPVPAEEAAAVCQAILYGLIAHHHLQHPESPDLQTLERQASTALQAYLQTAFARQA